MEVIPSLDLLDGEVVRLRQGRFADRTGYGHPASVLEALRVPAAARLHIVDLAGSRDGEPGALDVVRKLATRYRNIQVGGGVRTPDDVARWFDAGAAAVVTGTVAADNSEMFQAIVSRFGPSAIIPAVDVRDGVARVAGWTRPASRDLSEVLSTIEEAGIEQMLVTDISRDGLLSGPSIDLYRRLAAMTAVQIIASGGVTTPGDVVSLARLGNVSGCVIGRALLERQLSYAEARARAAAPTAIPPRIIPCLDVRDGRVVKGLCFEGIRDAGDPVECAMRYEAEGADEIAVLDISASDRGAATAVETVRHIADSLFVPLTVGGGVRSVHDFRTLLQAGADRVAVNTAAVRRPELISECAREFGVQAVVVSCDVKEGRVVVRSGKEPTGLDAVAWCREVERLGAGEILLTSIDRDGTRSGFDIDLLRSVTGAVRINVIASGGAGRPSDFAEAIARGGATAALAASLFHDRDLTIAEVKQHLAAEGIPVR